LDKELRKKSDAVLKAVSILSKAEPSVVFVGGSAIQQMLGKSKRLSIDLDLAYRGDPKSLISILEKEGYNIGERKNRDPMFVFYTATKDGTFIKIDITRLNITETEPMSINGVNVRRPKGCYFMASKLSTMAFGTIGRRDEEKSQVVKDIYDIDCLLDSGIGIGNMGTDWKRIVSDENEIRKRHYSPEDCLASVEKTLLNCIDVTGDPGMYITPAHIRDFSVYLLTGRVNRYDFPVMAARALLLAAHMDDGFYEIEKKALEDSKSRETLDEAEKFLKSKKAMPDAQIEALKINAPKALMYLKYWHQERHKDRPMTAADYHRPRFS